MKSAETPLFGQINVFAVWALKFERKCTTLNRSPGNGVPKTSPAIVEAESSVQVLGIHVASGVDTEFLFASGPYC